MKDLVKSLIKKAEKATTAAEALHYSQAALNAAQTLHTLKNLKSDKDNE
jgi:hypothetical protein